MQLSATVIHPKKRYLLIYDFLAVRTYLLLQSFSSPTIKKTVFPCTLDLVCALRNCF